VVLEERFRKVNDPHVGGVAVPTGLLVADVAFGVPLAGELLRAKPSAVDMRPGEVDDLPVAFAAFDSH
jgi:hypothetical protein